MDWRGRAETMVSLAMLPAGIIMFLVSAFAFLALTLVALTVLFTPSPNQLLTFLWATASALIAARNIKSSLLTMSALSWRQLAVTLLWSGVAIAIFQVARRIGL